MLNTSSWAYEKLKSDKRIVVFFSLAPDTPAYRPILDGIRQKLTAEFGENYNLHAEYLETERFSYGKYPKERFDLYNQKYRNVNLDMLICVGIDIISDIIER